jgi:hypothetical protein
MPRAGCVARGLLRLASRPPTTRAVADRACWSRPGHTGAQPWHLRRSRIQASSAWTMASKSVASRWPGRSGRPTHSLRGRAGGRQQPRLDAAQPGHRCGPGDHWSARATGPTPPAPGQTARRQGLPLPQMSQGAAAPGISPRIARRGAVSSQRLGRHRWKVERTLVWLLGCRLSVRYERRADLLRGCCTWPAPCCACGRSGEARLNSWSDSGDQGCERWRTQPLLGSAHGPPSSLGSAYHGGNQMG